MTIFKAELGRPLTVAGAKAAAGAIAERRKIALDSFMV
jgi:hypothetical protein